MLRYEPKVLVVYTGSNDLNAKLNPEEVLADYTAFLNLVHEKLPDCRIVINSVKISELRLKQIPAVKQLNSLLQAWCEGKNWVRWLESMNYLMDEKGLPKNELFRKDKLHLNEAGYAKWNEIIEPVIKEEWTKAGGKADEARLIICGCQQLFTGVKSSVRLINVLARTMQFHNNEAS